MSIASEITKLNSNLSDSYNACIQKSATIPANKNFDNLATCIRSIPSGFPNVKYSPLSYMSYGGEFWETNVENHYYLPNATEIDGGNYPVANPSMIRSVRMLSGCFPQLKTTTPFMASTITNVSFPKLKYTSFGNCTIENANFGLDGRYYFEESILGSNESDILNFSSCTLRNATFPNLKCQYKNWNYDNYWSDYETETGVNYLDVFQTLPVHFDGSTLENVTFGSLDYCGMIGMPFMECVLDNVSFPAMSVIPDIPDSIGNYGFLEGEITMRDVKFPNLVSIGDGGLRITDSINEEGATKLEFGDVKHIGNYAFPDDVKTLIFNTLDFENGTFALNSFSNLSELTALVFTCNFTNSEGNDGIILNSAYIRGGAWDVQRLLANTPIASGTGYIYVPDELVNTYKTTEVSSGWGYYASQIKGLSEFVG